MKPGIPLALIIATLTFGCGDRQPTATDLSVLKEFQEDFSGREVRVRGQLRTFDNPRHYWIENEARERVALEGAGDLKALVGQHVEVSGTFSYDPRQGRRIRVETLRASP